MVSVDAWMRDEQEKSEVKSPMLSKTEGHQPSALDLAHAPSDCACVLHRRPYLRARVNRHSRNARLLHRQAWLRMSGDVAGSAGQCHGVGHRGARPAGDSLRTFPLAGCKYSPPPCAEPPTANPDKYADELLRVSGFVLTNPEQTRLPLR